MSPVSRLHTVLSYEVLSDGTEVVVRTVRPGDDALLVEGFAQMGADSRYQRFFTPKVALTDAELDFLTHQDGERRYVLGALSWTDDGTVRPLGLARYVRVPPEIPGAPDATGPDDVAEAAIVVIDAMQGKGLGKLLLKKLAAAAWYRGVHRFRAEMLEDNWAIHKLVRSLDPHARVVAHAQGTEVIELKLPVPSVIDGRPFRVKARRSVPPAARGPYP